ncbi:RagB/SusD family nutrient uptake outer membrane protein [Joostella atrarenae]|uniref:RagB/SusD family nutrient uptake outer membrane protein n=1 Tax=Joostella atrarenae TaxID=679257 RepID=A0ABS9IZ43_9FLAO|nr:RagB/SusD family nutrient uptake outer membrane protein [Joostella atrarenae]MCF8713451.1 RagB/SusD family nutrient uptake outer membrane protein [Joostella atrarenae]
MKNFKYLVLLMTLVLASCSDLEEEPLGTLSPDGFVQSPDDIQSLVNGAIGNMATEAYWGRKLSLSIMVRGDMVSIGDQGTSARRKEVDNFTMNADNGMVSEFWPKSYQIIAGCNEAISASSNLSDSPAQIDPIRAQANFFRAYAYFHLVRLFGDIPYLENTVTVETFDDFKNIEKSTAAEVYTKIIADLQEAKTYLPEQQSNKSLPSKATAAAYLASVYLTMENYEMAYKEAKYVIDNEGKFGLGLENDFQDLFNADKQGGQSEVLLQLAYNGQSDGDTGRDYTGALTGIRANERGDIGGGWSVTVPKIGVYNTWDGRDYRKAVSLDTTGIFNGVVEPFTKFPDFDSRNVASAYIAKYTRFIGATGDSNGRTTSFNYPLMRYAEVLLIAAEALNETSPGSAEATSYVNRVRTRARNGNPNATGFPEDAMSGLSKDAFRDMVLEERKWELAFEFKRWYDIKRRKLGNEVFSTGSLDPQPNFDASRDYLFPLPADELERNPNLQPNNTGY